MTYTNIETYYLKLPAPGDSTVPSWVLEYTYKDAYQITRPITPSVMKKVVDKMAFNKNLFEKYVNYTFRNARDVRECFDDCYCKWSQMCAIYQIEFAEVDKCYRDNTEAYCSSVTVIPSIFLLISSVLLRYL